MTLTLDLPTLFVSIDERNDIAKLTDKTTGASKAMSVQDLTKLLHFGIRCQISSL